MGEEEELQQQYMRSNNNNYITESALALRLDTKELITNIEKFLRAKEYREFEEDGIIKVAEIDLGKPKANEEGIQGIMSYISSTINVQVVQGYFPEEHGYSEMFARVLNNFHSGLVHLTITNRQRWTISEYDLQGIIDFIMNMTECFLTRLVGDRERLSYSSTIKHLETNSMREKSNGFNLFGGNNKKNN